MTTTIQLEALSPRSLKSYVMAGLFVAGNIALPQLCHFTGLGGNVFLPIMFFTLIAAARYGLTTGLLTAVLSPLVNHALFGMPGVEMLSVIVIKSLVLAAVAGAVVQRTGKMSILALVMAVLAYQAVGFLAEGLFIHNFSAAYAAVAVSVPGMLVQVVAGWLVLRLIAKQ